jgi:sporulation protein YqfC
MKRNVIVKTTKEKATQKEMFMDKVISRLNIPEDILSGAEIMTMVGKRNLVIENYVKVVECETDRIVIKTKRNNLRIKGKKLKIEYLYDVELRISGIIDSINYI